MTDARQVIAKALGGEDAFTIVQGSAVGLSKRILRALEAEGWTVAKLEQVLDGWIFDDGTMGPVFRVAGPTEGETPGPAPG